MTVLSIARDLRVGAMTAVAEGRAVARLPDLPGLGRVGEGGTPVVIQGGLGSQPYAYAPLKQLLHRHGFGDVTIPAIRMHGLDSVPSDAALLRRAVVSASERSLRAGGNGLVSVLAHSKGGIVARHYVQQMDGLESVAQLVTLGTPHRGSAALGDRASRVLSRLPAVPGNAGMRDISSHSRIVRELNDGLPEFMAEATRRQPGFRVVSISTDLDTRLARASDGLVSNATSRLPDLPGISNEVHRGAHAGHMGIAGQGSWNLGAARSTVTHLGERSGIGDAVAGASLLG